MIIGIAVGALIGYLFSLKYKAVLKEVRSQADELRANVESMNNMLKDADAENIRLKSENLSLKEKLDSQAKDIRTLSERSAEAFRNVANEILEVNSKKFSERSSESLSGIINPFKEQLAGFRERVETLYSNENKERISLGQHIKDLMELNNRIREDASNLTKALKGDQKVQGDWGETILRTILENSGLTENEHFFIQETLRDKDGNVMRPEAGGDSLRPDVIVRLPNDRSLIIDSKVSLKDYVNYVNSDDEKERSESLKAHVASIRRHIDELAVKDYSSYVPSSPGFVMMFIPNEPAYLLAVQKNPGLWDYAYSKNVVMITPTSLISTLRFADDLWKRDAQYKNVSSIVDRATKLYSKAVLFCDSFLEIEKNISRASDSFNKARMQLSEGRGNLISQIRMLENFGIKGTRKLPASLSEDSLSEESEDPISEQF